VVKGSQTMAHIPGRWKTIAVAAAAWLWLSPGGASAQWAPPPPPPPPPPSEAPPPPPPNALQTARPPVPVVIVGRGPAPVVKHPPRRHHRRRHAPSPYGRFYVGAGAGYFWPSGALGKQYQSGGAFSFWTGWRKRWFGFELGYLGANLTRKYGEMPSPFLNGNVSDSVWDPYSGDAMMSQLSADAKVFLPIFCRSSIYARLGLNYTILNYDTGFQRDGFGWQSGLGWDWRIRLSFAPDLVMKLRAEGLYTWAKIKCGEGNCKALSGAAAMFYVNLGWSP
jgi:hypothetical protein